MTLREVLDELQRRGLLARTHCVQVADIRLELVINPRELHPDDSAEREKPPGSFDELLRRQLGLPREEKPQ